MAPAAKKAASSRRASASESDGDFKDSGLRVSAPLIQIQIGKQVLHLSYGDAVPEGVAKEQLDHLSDLGYVTKGDPVESSDDE